MAVWYLDTSAVAKLVRPERETANLQRWMRHRRWIVSDLHRTELRRAAARAGERAPARADRLLAESDVMSITAEVFDRAGAMAPPLAYDDRLALAASRAGLKVASPGAATTRTP